jgi:tetratricopeptide (TPR) repeat protein
MTNAHKLIRIVAPAAALGCYLWAASADPRAHSIQDGAADVLSLEESRQILEESKLLQRQGQNQRALENLLKLYEAYPDNQIYSEELATLYGHLGNHREEAAYWEDFMRHAPLPEEACPQIGQAYEHQGLRTEATDAFRRCLALQPNNPDSIFYLAHTLEMSREYMEAEGLYERGTAVDPLSFDMRTSLARVKLRLGKIADARRIAAKVIDEKPDYVDDLLVLALIDWQEGNTTEAKSCLARGIEISGSNMELHEVLGRIAEQTGDTKTALHEYSVALDLGDTTTEIAQRRATLLRKSE